MQSGARECEGPSYEYGMNTVLDCDIDLRESTKEQSATIYVGLHDSSGR
jgi:hypothetical protein